MQIEESILQSLNPEQREVVSSSAKRILVIAGAGSGKTEVMARRIAWWVGIGQVPKEKIVAFTFTERAAEEMKFRIRRELQQIAPPGTDSTLGGMYVGTIHGFCLHILREFAADRYYNFDVLDEGGRFALLQRGFSNILGMTALKAALGDRVSQNATIEQFIIGYDLLNEYDLLDVELPSEQAPVNLGGESEWCKRATLRTDCGADAQGRAFAVAVARYYAYLQCRRFLDFSTCQTELLRAFRDVEGLKEAVNARISHIVVDEVQDLNPVQDSIVRLLVGQDGHLTAVGDHRQAIYRFRGGRVDLMARMDSQIRQDAAGKVFELKANYRSTQRIIDLANRWSKTIGATGGLANPDMLHGNTARVDEHTSHVSVSRFTDTESEARWIADTINDLIDLKNSMGARHDSRDGDRGLGYSDVAVLVRSSTDARTYMRVLEDGGIPSVVRAGPDLFSQPEVLLFLGALALSAGVDAFMGRLIESQITTVLGSGFTPREVVRASVATLAEKDHLHLANDVVDRLLLATSLVRKRIDGEPPATREVLRQLQTPSLRKWLADPQPLRRVFPQQLFHQLLEEAGVAVWGAEGIRGRSAIFHLGQFSTLVKMIETPGWNTPGDLKFQIVSLYMWGVNNARIETGPLMVAPDAVTISTIHGAKGLEFSCVFVADVKAQRFPSNRAAVAPQLPFGGQALRTINPSQLADNDNCDDERRLMYVALTRAERFLFISGSGGKQSRFMKELIPLIRNVGGVDNNSPASSHPRPTGIRRIAVRQSRDSRLVTSFSDLRYFLECPHDFYLRKVLGFAPSIDQAFGYGRCVHNLLRAVHSEPIRWAGLASDPEGLSAAVRELMASGLFFMRYTTGQPLENMRSHAMKLVSEYVKTYASELSSSSFEPERGFETLLEEERVLVAGAIDLIRFNSPPRVTLIDFKSGQPDSDAKTKLDEDEMRLQIGIYGLAAKKELEYEPEDGLVRYLGETNPAEREIRVDLTDESLRKSRERVVEAARKIRLRTFQEGPYSKPRKSNHESRCEECDFLGICSLPGATEARGKR